MLGLRGRILVVDSCLVDMIDIPKTRSRFVPYQRPYMRPRLRNVGGMVMIVHAIAMVLYLPWREYGSSAIILNQICCE